MKFIHGLFAGSLCTSLFTSAAEFSAAASDPFATPVVIAATWLYVSFFAKTVANVVKYTG